MVEGVHAEVGRGCSGGGWEGCCGGGSACRVREGGRVSRRGCRSGVI